MTSRDHDILEQLRRGEERAVDALFEDYFAALCSAAFRIVNNVDAAKDVVQDVFVKVWTQRETLNVKTSLWGYLKQSVVNASIDATRRSYEQRKTPLESAGHLETVDDSAEQEMEGHEADDLVREAISRLPERCRLVFTLSRHEELTYNQIAETLDISPKTVEAQMSKALKLLRAWLKPLLVVWFTGSLVVIPDLIRDWFTG